jgi:3-hydroxyacyl-[acyl-carrier-protein] dehydratase
MMQHLLEGLPHGEPFLFVTEVLGETERGFEASWRIRGDEDWLRGHFPRKPIVPGVLITEALGQACGLSLLARSGGIRKSGMLAQAEIRFRAPVFPPASIALISRLDREFGDLMRFHVTASCEGRTVADGALVLVLTDPD